MFIQNNSGWNGSPVIALAIGDNDTGLNWGGDGHILAYANNQPVFSWNQFGVTFNDYKLVTIQDSLNVHKRITFNDKRMINVYIDHGGDTNTRYYYLGKAHSNNGILKVQGIMGGHALVHGRANVDLQFSYRDGFRVDGEVIGRIGQSDIYVYAPSGDSYIYIYLVTNIWALVNLELSAVGVANIEFNETYTTIPPTFNGNTIPPIFQLSTDTSNILRIDNDGNTNIVGNLSVSGSISGNFNGNALTATRLQTARTIALSGKVTGSASFDGSSNITINTSIPFGSITGFDIANNTIQGYHLAPNAALVPLGDYSFNSINWNNISNIATYRINSGGTGGSNQPPATSQSGLLTVLKGHNGAWTQIYIPSDTNDKYIYIRQNHSTTSWSSWRSILADTTKSRILSLTGPVTGSATYNLDTGTISVPTSIAAGAVGTTQLADNSVTSIKLAPGAVTGNLGYTPVNRAGDVMTGNLTVPGLTVNGNINSTGVITGRYDFQNRFTVSGSTTDTINIAANSFIFLQSIGVIVPSGKTLYLRRVRFFFGSSSAVNFNVNRPAYSVNIGTGPLELAPNVSLISGSGNTGLIAIGLFNPLSSNVSVQAGSGWWLEFEIV